MYAVELKLVYSTYCEAKQTKTLAFGAAKRLLQEPCKEDCCFLLKRPELSHGFHGRRFYRQNLEGELQRMEPSSDCSVER